MAEPSSDLYAVTRRTFLGGATATTATTLLSAPAMAAGASTSSAIGDGYWLGPQFWGNRLQDWVHRSGRIECVASAGHRIGRTVSWLTREIAAPPFTLTVRTGTLEGGAGFSGFLLGTGVAGEDWRRRVLVGAASGTGGGLLAVYEADGSVRFRDHTAEVDQLAYAPLPGVEVASGRRRSAGEDVLLELRALRRADGNAMLVLRVRDFRSGTLLSIGRMRSVPPEALQGGIGLMSSARAGSSARYWFARPTAEGEGVRRYPGRAFGPVAGTLFTVSGSVLKMTAQLMPVDTTVMPRASLEVDSGGRWQRIRTEPVGPGYAVAFRVKPWDASRAHGYRVVVGGRAFRGRIPAEPRGSITLATMSCTKASHRALDRPSTPASPLRGSHRLDLYGEANLYFPHDRLARAIGRTSPDLLVVHGDQLYETSPTAKPANLNPELDYLYKYLLWVWSFRSITRDTPTVVLLDDHDMYQGNVWGAGGVRAPRGQQWAGGYVNDAAWVNVVQRVSCGHNPDPFDPTPVAQGIGVYYTSFSYGGVSMAVVEDRKFKSGADGLGPTGQPIPEESLDLLGERQEAFLTAWTGQHAGQPKILLTQTVWACVQTTADGLPHADRDTNGWPPAARTRALDIVRRAHALMLCGDQHIGFLASHRLGDAPDGPVQFAPPAGSSSYQRWFEPVGPLARPEGQPFTGDWVDGFGNALHLWAVVNPSFTQAEYRAAHPGTGQDFGDRALKNEGFGVVAIDHATKSMELRCWRWDADPAAPGAQQFPGFPRRLRFDQL